MNYNSILKLAFLTVFLPLSHSLSAQIQSWRSHHKLHQDIIVKNQYKTYFESAYERYPEIPKGILEAVSFTNTRIRHISPSTDQQSCTGMPLPYGVMGLFFDGKNHFRENLKTVAQLSGTSIELLKNDSEEHILAYAKAFNSIAAQKNIKSQNFEDYIPVLIALSELPFSNLLDNYAMDSWIYSVLTFLNDENHASNFGFIKQNIDLQKVFGLNYFVLSSAKVFISSEGISDGEKPFNPYISQSQLNKTASSDYTPAIWDPTTCNFSSRSGTAITHYAIHTVQGTYSGCISWFKNCSANASAHYVIRSSDGQVTQMILESDKAWHVGSENPYTIGTEHEGYVSDPAWYTTAMYNSSAALARDIVNSGYGINSLRTYHGDPSSVVTSTGGCVKIKGHQHYPNQTHTDPGINWNWQYFYTLVNNNPNILTYTTLTGTIQDPGGALSYSNDQRQCYLIAPTGATSLSLTFTTFDLEANWDFLYIYDGQDNNGTFLGKFSGTSLPGTITSTTGKLFLDFRTDCATTSGGFVANWAAQAPDLTAPTTSVTLPSGFQTTNFNATFTDNDNVGFGDKYYLVANNGSSNFKTGFAFETFTNVTDWINYSGTWTNTNGILNQSDETNSNTNYYKNLNQDNSTNFLYQYNFKIDGAVGNRRSGFHFFCDDANAANRNNSYFVFFRADDSKLHIYKTKSDVFTLVAEFNLSISAGTWHQARILFNPNTGKINVWFNGVPAGDWTDASPFVEGSHVSFRSGNCNASFDDLRIYRSRSTSSQLITVNGSSMDIINGNINPTTPACTVYSIVKDIAGNWSTESNASNNVDFTVPTTITTVNDGSGTDIATTTDGNRILANWTTSTDANSGILRYEYAIGTTAGGTNIATWTSTGTTTSVSHAATLTNATTYYVSVRSVNNAGLISAISTSNGQTYQANTCTTDTYEANETRQTAKAITTGSTKYAYVCPANDIDWFSFTNTSTYKHIKVSLTSLPFDYDLELYNSSGVLVGSSYAAGVTSEKIIYNNAAVGTYFVKVFGYNGATHSTDSYALLCQRSSTTWTSKMENEEYEHVLKVFPNPSTSNAFIEFSVKESGTKSIELFNLTGQKIWSTEQFFETGIQMIEIPLKDFATGMYILKTEQGSVKVVKE